MPSYILLIFHLSILFPPAFFDSYRLPDYVLPKHYDLKILASIEDEIIYTGTLDIVIQCLNATKKISLHRDWSIKFDKIELKEIDAPQNYKIIREIPMEEILYSNIMGTLTIYSKKYLKEYDYYLIHFEFKGNLSDTPNGIFRGNFSSSSGTSSYAIALFEPMGARRAFPCFDEPGMTATFGLSIGRKEKFNSTSNMQRLKTEPVEGKNGWYWDHFMNSLPMSTYSVCFMIYDAGFTQIGEKHDQIKIFARKEMQPDLKMVTKTLPKVMAYFQEYFQLPFPLPKMEFFVLPNKGGKVSMSTPGLDIIQEKSLLYEPFTMKQAEVQDILFRLSQKIAFQWISVVSINWWSDLWVTISLANLNARDAMSSLSETEFMEKDIPDALLHYFHQGGSLPLSGEVYGDLNSVTAALSSIDYKKCGLLMRIAQHLTGNTAVKHLTTSFLKKKSFQKINLSEFWKIFEITSKTLYNGEVPLSEVIKSWSNQSGVPVIEVRRNYKSETALILQTTSYRNFSENIPYWWIPITYVSKSEAKAMNTYVRAWLKYPNDTVKISSLSSSDWLLLNIDVNPPYRVNYDVGNWKLLHSTLKHPSLFETIPSLNRMQLVNDLFEFTVSKDLNVTPEFLLEFMEFLRFDQSYATWTAFSKNMYILHWRLQSNKEAVDLLDSYMQNILRRHFREKKIYIKENSLKNISFSTVIIEAACFFKLPGCLKEVKTYYNKYKTSQRPFHVDNSFSADLRDVIFCYAIKHGSVDDFNFLLEAYTNSKNIFEKRDMLRGLYCTQDASLLKRIPISRRIARSVDDFDDQISKTKKVGNIAENVAKSKSTILEDRTTTTEIFRIELNTLNTNSDQNSSVANISASSSSTTSAGNSSTTTSMENSSNTSISTNSSDTSVTASGNVSDNLVSPGLPSLSNASEGLGSIGQIEIDLNIEDLEYIIRLSKIDVVSDLFYENVVTVPLPEVLRLIWLFTERINEKKELKNLENFFKKNGQIFIGVEQQIKNRIKHVEHNLKWQENKTEDYVKALRKYLGVKEQIKSDAFKYTVNTTWELFIILGILSISSSHVYSIK